MRQRGSHIRRSARVVVERHGELPARCDTVGGDEMRSGSVARWGAQGAARVAPPRFAADENGWTDLHHAAALTAPDLARRLLAAGVAVDARLRVDGRRLSAPLRAALAACGQDRFDAWRRTGCTPLHPAVPAGTHEVVPVLLEGGADPDAVDTQSATPLHSAAHVGDSSVATALLAAGADADARTGKDVTPLHVAARRNAGGVAAVLLTCGAAVDPRTVVGDTPLHRAAAGAAAAPEAAAVLLACGADVDARGNAGASPLHVAAMKDAHATASLLLPRRADVESWYGDGASPLHVAAVRNAVAAAVLLAAGADRRRAGRGGPDAAPLGGRRGAGDAVAVLAERGADVGGRTTAARRPSPPRRTRCTR